MLEHDRNINQKLHDGLGAVDWRPQPRYRDDGRPAVARAEAVLTEAAAQVRVR